jgi:hypothetical protein
MFRDGFGGVAANLFSADPYLFPSCDFRAASEKLRRASQISKLRILFRVRNVLHQARHTYQVVMSDLAEREFFVFCPLHFVFWSLV